MHLREPTEWFVTEKRTGEMEPAHDHSTGIICHLPEELSEQPTGKGVNSQVLQVTYIVSSASVLLLWPRQSHCLSAIHMAFPQVAGGNGVLPFLISLNQAHCGKKQGKNWGEKTEEEDTVDFFSFYFNRQMQGRPFHNHELKQITLSTVIYFLSVPRTKKINCGG